MHKTCHNEYTREHYAANKQYYKDKKARRERELMELIREAKQKPCADCQVEYPYYVMDFDHRPGEDKAANLSSMAKAGNKTKILTEIAKCDVVCSNCHRIRTHGRLAFVSPLATNELEA